MIDETIPIKRARRIKEAIDKNGYTYVEIAKLTGISKSSIQRYATGEQTAIPVDNLEAIARATHVSPIYLMCWETEAETTKNVAAVYSSQDEAVRAMAGYDMSIDELSELKLFTDFLVWKRSHSSDYSIQADY